VPFPSFDEQQVPASSYPARIVRQCGNQSLSKACRSCFLFVQQLVQDRRMPISGSELNYPRVNTLKLLAVPSCLGKEIYIVDRICDT
jgi:hypothetical protein